MAGKPLNKQKYGKQWRRNVWKNKMMKMPWRVISDHHKAQGFINTFTSVNSNVKKPIF